MFRIGLLAAAAVALSGCSATLDRLDRIGEAPGLTRLPDGTQPNNGFQTVSLPAPPPVLESPQANSLWTAGRRGFFRDQRAAREGDILTVTIEIDDEATIKNRTARSRQNAENAGMNGLFGLPGQLDNFLPDEVVPEDLINLDSATNSVGTGSIARAEQIDLRVAAIVTQVLPNGNLVIQGRQEVRVNFERRDLVIAGVIRPEDIAPDNTISYEKIAEARIAYGGEGQITDVQQPRYGQQLVDVLFPF